MIIINGHIKTDPALVHDLAADLATGVERTKAEDGCIFYAFAIDDAAAGTILAVERWRDQASLDAGDRRADGQMGGEIRAGRPLVRRFERAGLRRMSPAAAPLAIVQNCYVVRDLDAACARLNALYGIGPFVGGSEAELSSHRYRGEAAPPIRIRGVFVQSGDLNVELVQLLSDTPSAFHDMFAGGGEGFHHVAMFCADYAARRDAMIAAGYPLVSEFTATLGEGDEVQICYLDARDTLGHMIELYPEHAVIRDMYRQARDAATGWDGRDLIVPWGSV